MPRMWAWFDQPSRVLSVLDQLGGTVSVLVRDPKVQEDVVVMGPITRDMACYPFLDVPHQIRRFGVRRQEAEHYVQALLRGGAVVCVDSGDANTKQVLDQFDAQDVLV